MKRLRAALSLAALLAPAIALADARVEARRHFRTGMALINKERYEDGISELDQAYAIKPHPSVLYNIARAYLISGKVPEAIGFYKRYLASNPPDAETVEATVAHLEATLPAATPPVKEKEKEKERPSERPPRVSPGPGADDAVARLNALTDRLEAAVKKAEGRAPKAPVAERGAEAEPDEADAEGVPYEETVVTASRRAQTSLEAPNATTVITAEEIRLSGATSLQELLRRVPGAEVMATGVGSANVTFRGFNQRIANKVLVLLDGRPEYQDFLGMMLWPGFPIGLEEIDRIEVIRGPGSALYGANAMLGVVNIITRSPGKGPAAELNAIGGTGNTAGGSFVASGGQNLKYRASAGYLRADKWSRDYQSDRPDITPQVADPNLGLSSARANLTTHYAFSRQVSVSASGGVNRLYTEVLPVGILRNFYLDGVTSYVKTDLNAGPVKLRLFWNHLSADDGPQYSALGQASLLNHIESNVFDAELLFSQVFDWAGTHRIDGGLSGRVKNVNWGFLSGPKSELHAAAFLQDEWKIAEPVRVVASYRIDRHPLLNDGRPGFAQSPRISAVFLPIEGHAFRASFATAFREPSFLESYTQVRIPLPGVNGASALTTGNLSLKAEQLTAFELGYRGEAPAMGLDWDLTLYRNEVHDLVGLSPPTPLPAGEDFDPRSQTYLLGRSVFVNEPGVYVGYGAEAGLKFSPIDRLDLKASASLAW